MYSIVWYVYVLLLSVITSRKDNKWGSIFSLLFFGCHLIIFMTYTKAHSHTDTQTNPIILSLWLCMCFFGSFLCFFEDEENRKKAKRWQRGRKWRNQEEYYIIGPIMVLPLKLQQKLHLWKFADALKQPPELALFPVRHCRCSASVRCSSPHKLVLLPYPHSQSFFVLHLVRFWS